MKIYRTTPQQQRERVAREAAEWLQAMQAEPGAAEREAFADWLASSPAHVREMLLAGMLDRELARPGMLDRYDIDAVVAQARAQDNVVALPTTAALPTRASRHVQPPRRATRWRRAAASLAAVLVLAMAGWGALRTWTGAGIEYATAIGEQRSIRLDDGTLVKLAPDSRINVRLSAGQRQIVLRQGEAEFDVVHDASRPFRVYAGANLIQDIGTRFSVNRLPSGTIVAVTEGSVQVSPNHLAALDNGLASWAASWLPARVDAIGRPGVRVEALDQAVHLEAGEAAHIDRRGKALTRGSLDEEREAPANNGRLTFHDDTLADIVAEFNRYNTRQIVIADATVRLDRYSGVFDANDPDSFLQFLDCCSRLTAVRRGKQVVIQSRPAASAQRR